MRILRCESLLIHCPTTDVLLDLIEPLTISICEPTDLSTYYLAYVPIRWTSHNLFPPTTVQLVLLQSLQASPNSFAVLRTIATGVSNTGYYLWTPDLDGTLAALDGKKYVAVPFRR